MLLGSLEAHWCGDLQCPHCKIQLRVNWDTEYGDPLPGEYTENCCPNCAQSFSFDVEVTTTYTVKKES